MRGTKAKRLRKLGLKSGPVKRAPLTGEAKSENECRQMDAKFPYFNARRGIEII